ncbi:hypothetical protein [Candidatus Gromoviella agglomerans]|uniref:hypothetical protein n=1 Tax=Candidatus Gromoviella agglomerans TaxID=2806609 RepID=UPI001E29C44A|nr:hypothetical protein [Candidatus Gromoviella agglomerans]
MKSSPEVYSCSVALLNQHSFWIELCVLNKSDVIDRLKHACSDSTKLMNFCFYAVRYNILYKLRRMLVDAVRCFEKLRFVEIRIFKDVDDNSKLLQDINNLFSGNTGIKIVKDASLGYGAILLNGMEMFDMSGKKILNSIFD